MAKFEKRPPYEAEFVWHAYCEMSGDRDALVGMSGAMPKRITFRDLAAWCEVHQVRLSFWETRALRELDDLYMKMQPTKTGKAS